MDAHHPEMEALTSMIAQAKQLGDKKLLKKLEKDRAAMNKKLEKDKSRSGWLAWLNGDKDAVPPASPPPPPKPAVLDEKAEVAQLVATVRQFEEEFEL